MPKNQNLDTLQIKLDPVVARRIRAICALLDQSITEWAAKQLAVAVEKVDLNALEKEQQEAK